MKTVDLCGEWILHNADSRKEISGISMNIPGDIHSALIREKIIPDPYYSFNEREVQWVGREKWKISRSFSFHKKADSRTCLCISMADTFFTVYINSKKAAEGDNYFRIWRFDVTDFLKEGNNQIEIVFDSAEKIAVEKAKKLPYPVPYMKYDMVSPNRNLVRKIQCQAGWDWGPCLMVSGIYGNIYLDTVEKGFLQSVTAETVPCKKNDFFGKWKLQTGIRYFSYKNQSVTFLIELDGHGISESVTVNRKVHEGENNFSAELTVNHPELWKTSDELKDWNLKANALYDLTVTAVLLDDAENNSACEEHDFPREDSCIEKQIGFRCLTLKAEPDKNGCSLYYELNGRKIFAKGANWIPVDSLPERWTAERYRYFLKSAVDANMNSLRFWGGGQYESDLCYSLCDEMGIIVWQDCAFGCSLYPSGEEFLLSVEKEIEDNVYRLQSHPSLALWCGNNENLGALNWFEESRNNRDRYIVDYDRLNHGVVEKTVRRCDPARTWWPSSPCAGPDTFGDNWHNDSEGDMHFWSVWHEKKDMEAYLSIKPRFVSEFGFESFPSMEGVLEFAPEDQINLTSPVMEWHQRSPGGNSIMLENFSRYFRFPESTENMLYLSQVQQAVAVKCAVDYWRSLRPHCMGATYWQLNDVWPVASWSSIEYSGKWKLLQYAAKRFFSRAVFSLIKNGDEISAHLINETKDSMKVSADISLYDFTGKCLGSLKTIKTELKSDTASCVWKINSGSINIKGIKTEADGTVDLSKYFIHAEAKAVCGSKEFILDDTLFFERWKKCNLEKPEIKAEVKNAGGEIRITLNALKPAFFTSLDVPYIKGIFSENMFTLLPGKEKTVTFTADNYGMNESTDIPSVACFKKSLKIVSLRDTY